MPDVRLFNTVDGGEITATNGQLQMSVGIETAVYLSLFGGNDDDSGSQADESKQWWGNLDETVSARRYRSETQALLRSIPAIPANLRRISDAVARDLAWMQGTVADAIQITVTMPALNRVRILVQIEISGKTQDFTFDENWGAVSS